MSEPASVAAATYRIAVDSDRPALLGLAKQDLTGTPYAPILAYFLRLALNGESDESRAIVAERGGAVAGVTVFGAVAGTIGTARIHFVGVTTSARSHAIGVGLCEAAVSDLASKGARLVIAEVADDPALAPGRALLARCGFVETARVPDYYRDGVDLIILERSGLAPP